MRLFIAREALDTHVQKIFAILDSKISLAGRIRKALEATGHYALWYPKQWIYGSQKRAAQSIPAALKPHVRYVGKAAHRLARNLFHAMMLYQQGLEKKQMVLTRIVNIGTDLFAMAAALSRAISLAPTPSDPGSVELADLFCRQARGRVEKQFHNLFVNNDRFTYSVAQETLKGKYRWLAEGIIAPAGVSWKPSLKFWF
jgi:hypothetical protein